MKRVWQVAVDCEDPERLAAVWAEVLGYEPRQPLIEDGGVWVLLVDPDGVGPTVLFHRVPEPKVVKNRVHLDVWVGERGGTPDERRPAVDAEVERLVALGATRSHAVDHDGTDYFVVMLDPEGNELCVA